MTVWAPTMIARWLREAGLPEYLITHGVALSLAATQGADHYRENPTSVPELERRGIFALKASDVPDGLDVDLFSPTDSATALVAAYRANGDRWDWHPVHVSGQALKLHPVVVMMLKDRNAPKGAVDVRSFAESVGRVAQVREAVRQAGPHRGP